MSLKKSSLPRSLHRRYWLALSCSRVQAINLTRVAGEKYVNDHSAGQSEATGATFFWRFKPGAQRVLIDVRHCRERLVDLVLFGRGTGYETQITRSFREKHRYRATLRGEGSTAQIP